MCLDGNSAALSVRYLNAQLQALWENADECAKHAGYTDFKSAEYDKSRYTRAIREFHYLTKRSAKNLSEEELFFVAKFGQPKLKFICNHEAVLFLTIQTGHFNLAHKEALKAGARADKTKNSKIDNLELVFRTPFIRTNVHARDDKIGNVSAKHLIQMIVLQLDKANLIMYNPEKLSIDLKDALAFYLTQYLAFLQTSGNHVLFDLSDFDDDKHRPAIDYALIHNDETEYLIRHHSDEIKLLGNLECVILAKFYDMHWVTQSSLRNEQSWATLDICLATICSDWLVSSGSQLKRNFFINFNKPIIEALCPHEVIVKFHIKELGFFDEPNISEKSSPRDEYRDWKVAFIISVVRPESSGLLQLDLDTARFSRYHSDFGMESNEVIDAYVKYMISFFEVDYLDIIARLQLHIILGFPAVPVAAGDEYSEDYSGTDEGEGDAFRRKHGKALLWSERIQKTAIQGEFDQVIALSEDSINRVLRSRCGAVSTWEQGRFFSMEMLPLSVRLLSRNKAIVYVQAEGMVAVNKKVASTKWWVPWKWRLPTETDELERFDFDTITLAYEVDLKLVAHDHRKETELHSVKIVDETVTTKTTVTKYNEYEIFVRAGATAIRYVVGTSTSEQVESTERVVKVSEHVKLTEDMFYTQHLVLDYSSARYVKELSDVTALGTGDEALERLSTVKVYIPEYLHTLVHFGHHILHTVPVCKTLTLGSSDLFAFTSVGFKVLTKREISVDTCLREDRNTSEMPLVVLFGVCGGQPLPPFTGTWLPGIVPVGQTAVGTLTLASKVLLERYILQPLKVVNEATTIVPSAADVVDGVWIIELTSWAQHKTRSKSRVGCQWTRVNDNSLEYLTYEWKYRDEWSHEHEGNSSDDEANGEYTLACTTRNVLRIPTFYSPNGLEIKLEGTSSVKLGGKTNHEKWFKRTSATWSAVIKMETTPTGSLKISYDYSAPHVRLEEEHARASEWCPLDIVAKHGEVMTSKVAEFELVVLPQLRTAVEHTWKYTTMGIQTVSLRDPVFTRRGDLICEFDLQKDAIFSELFDKKEWNAHCGDHPVITSEKDVIYDFDYSKRNTVVNNTIASNGNGTYDKAPIANKISPAVTKSNGGSANYMQIPAAQSGAVDGEDNNDDSNDEHPEDDDGDV